MRGERGLGQRGGRGDKFRRKRETSVQQWRRWKATGKVRQSQTEPERKFKGERKKKENQEKNDGPSIS